MITDSRTKECSIPTYSHIDYAKHEEWSIDEWLANGGQIKAVIKEYSIPPDILLKRDVKRRLKIALRTHEQTQIAHKADVSLSRIEKIVNDGIVSLQVYEKVKKALDKMGGSCE